jgi:transposase
VLRQLVEDDNDATLAELAERLRERTGVELVVSAVHKVLVKMGISRKKKTSTRASASATTSGS